jgi:hypothetical protein
MDDTLDMLELYNGESNVLYTSTANRPFIIRDLGSQNNQMIINSNTSLFNNTNDTLIVNGSVKVYGDMDITGTYKLSGNAITITNSQAEYDLELNNTQDILIAGTDIFINPNQQNNKRLYLGYTQEKYNNYVEGITTSALLNILRLRDIDEEYIANFTSEDNSVLVRLFSESRNKTVDIGMTSTNIFSIINPDRPTKPLLTFTDNSAYSRLGIGTTSTENTSMVNIFNSSSGTDIFRITRYTNTTSTGVANIAPNMTLHKKLSTTNYEWRFIGPEASYRQKLQFNYKDTSTPETEIYTFTSNGCFGIGNTQPTYAVDIRTSGTTGCIRMHQTDTNVAKPQLLFQSGANEYGVDTSTDFRMYSYSNNFYLDMQDILRGQQTLFHFTSNGSLGIHQNADSQYSVSIDGKLNVSDKIYINGSEVFTTTLGTDITLTGGNIILNPDTSSYNGLSINYNGGTSNLLYVKSGNDGNMLVLDSDYEEAQINFRVLDNTTTKRLHRIGASNQSLIIEYGSNDVYNNLTNTFNDNHDGYYRTAEISYDGTTFNTDINTNLNVTGSTSIIYENDTFDDPALYVDGIAKFTSNVYIENDLDVTNNLHVHGCYINDSDRRIKYDIQPLDNALDKIKKLSGYTFNKYNTNKRLTGLIAQEVNEVLPEAVFIDDTDILGIDYGSLMGLIIEGIKELSIQLDDIKKRLD